MLRHKALPKLMMISSCLISLTACSSIMSHTGDNRGYYLGTQANNELIGSHETSWPIKSLAVLDYPFSAVTDTLILPWDYYRNHSDGSSLRDRVAASEKLNHTDEALAQANTNIIQ
ncbi:YceK/YidQ family lipoprotein [Tatumella sp. TA1]|uniref:YceK/YidQ family lipoprotein n=1 Tax=Rosenbergiella collisarenosi TaxID=1544695 RepID=UPI0008F8A47C|nr:YceK/YidQ family lipoprotein [Rosenbergiella collisarenosi]MBT0722236.1 YceK/YidQ family lipoprotein [Rosenbergiella collisarenosi]QGX90157.1 YceK/YidQ family lipoprotein [Tatumella sp. TA1]